MQLKMPNGTTKFIINSICSWVFVVGFFVWQGNAKGGSDSTDKVFASEKQTCITRKNMQFCVTKIFDKFPKINLKGEVITYAKSLSIKSLDGRLSILAEEVSLKVKLSSILTSGIVPIVQKASNVTIDIDVRKNANPEAKKIYGRLQRVEVVQSAIISAIEIANKTISNWTKTNEDNKNAKKVIENATIVIKYGSSEDDYQEITLALHDTEIANVIKTKSKSSMSSIWMQRKNELVLSGTAKTQSGTAPFVVSCYKGLVNNICEVNLKSIGLGFVNPFLKTLKNEEMLDFKDLLIGEALIVANLDEKNPKIVMTGQSDSIGKINFANKDSVIVSPFKFSVDFLPRTMHLAIDFKNLRFDGAYDVNLGFAFHFLNVDHKSEFMKVKFSTPVIRHFYLKYALDLISTKSNATQIITNAIFSNINPKNGAFSVQSGLVIISFKGEILMVDIKATIRDFSLSIIPINNLLISNASGEIDITQDSTKVKIIKASIGREKIPYASLVFSHRVGKVGTMNIDLQLDKANLLNVINNESLPREAKIIATSIDLSPKTLISGNFRAFFHLTSPIDTSQGFAANGKFLLTNVKTIIGKTNKQPIVVDILNTSKDSSVQATIDLTDASLWFGRYKSNRIMIKESTEGQVLTFTLMDILQPKQNKIIIKDISLKGNRELISNGKIEINPQDSFESSIISANIPVLKIGENDISFDFQKQVGQNYNFALNGKSFDFCVAKGIWNALIPPGNIVTDFDELSVNGSARTDRVRFFKNITGNGMILNMSIDHGVIKNGDFSIGLNRSVKKLPSPMVPIKMQEKKNEEEEDEYKKARLESIKRKEKRLIEKIKKANPGLFNDKNEATGKMEDSILVLIEKNSKKNKVYANVTNLRTLLDATGLGIFGQLKTGEVRVNARQTDIKSISGEAFLSDAALYAGDEFEQNLENINPHKIGIIKSGFSVFDYNLKDRVLSFKDLNVDSSIIGAKAKGYIDFKKNEIYADGIFKVHVLKAEDFGVVNIPVFGEHIVSIRNTRRGIVELAFIINGNLDRMETGEISIKPTKKLFFIVGIGSALVLALIGGIVGALV